MIAKLSKHTDVVTASITLPGSKSESNRLLILQALYPGIVIENISISDDTAVLQKALANTNTILDIHHAGTAMRFLTPYLAATTQKEIILTGSARMQERPIGILVTALRTLGAKITYTQKEGYPPLCIAPCVLQSQVSISANVSSQYISALLLIAPHLEKGLLITLEGAITSRPYIEMTLMLLKKIGVSCSFKDQVIEVLPLKSVKKSSIIVEGDWSSASYYYSLVALSKNLKVRLSSFKIDSLQGDTALVLFYENLGVTTTYIDAHTILLSKNNNPLPSVFKADLTATPDLAQTIAVTCFGLAIPCHLRGLHTLKIKETDRLRALHVEFTKLGAVVYTTGEALRLEGHTIPLEKIINNPIITTYQDHRMAMAFAPMAMVLDEVQIEEPNVVVKSYPDYWKDLASLGFEC